MRGNKPIVSIPTRYESFFAKKSKEKNAFSRRTSRFASTMSKLPGPGHYSRGSSSLVKDNTSISKRGYGQLCSREKRFSRLPTRLHFNPRIGPGSYKPMSQEVHEKRVHMNRLFGDSMFIKPQNKSLHVIKNDKYKLTPGPGSYFTYDGRKKTKKLANRKPKSAVFASQTARAMNDVKRMDFEREIMEEERRANLNKLKRGGRFVEDNPFSRASKRKKKKKKKKILTNKLLGITFGGKNQSQNSSVPGPGHYNVNAKSAFRRSAPVTKRRRPHLFTNSVKYFNKEKHLKKKKRMTSIGPGRYNPYHFEESRRYVNQSDDNKGSYMFSSSNDRFKKKKGEPKDLIGPGEYSGTVSSFQKKTFHFNSFKKWV